MKLLSLNKYNRFSLSKLGYALFAMNRALSFLLCTLLCSLFVSCSEDLDFSQGIIEVPEGVLQISVAVPDPVSVSTRGGESDVNSLDVFIFPNSGGDPQFIHYSSVPASRTVNVALNGNTRNGSVVIYAVANVSELQNVKNQISSSDDLKKYVLNSTLSLDSGIPMMGYRNVNTSSVNSANVSLYRVAAKISAECTVSGITVEGLQAYNFSTKAYLGSWFNSDPYIIKENDANAELSSVNSKDFSVDENICVYTYPSKCYSVSSNKSDIPYTDKEQITVNDGAFVVVCVKRDNKERYYRINLRHENESGSLEYLDWLANHHYKIEITGFMTDGYDSYDEAALHPESDQYVVYKIHDHVPEVLSMITDGSRELGVTPEVTLISNTDKKTFIVKCFDAANPEAKIYYKEPGNLGYDANPNYSDFTIISKSDWLNIEYKGERTEEDFNKYWDWDDHGTQHKFEVSLSHSVYEDQTGEIKFYWMGLTRTVTVSYESEFLLHEVSDVTLTIKDNDSNKPYEIKDYWSFVTGQGTSKEKEGNGSSLDQTPQLYGITVDDMPATGKGVKKRTGGFHFPMPYGDKYDSQPWEYIYTIDFRPLLNLDDTGSEITEIKYSFSDKTDPFIKTNVKYTEDQTDKWKGTLELTGDVTSYDYAGGSIIFTITHKTGENEPNVSEIVASVYHTGFFHYEGNEKGQYVPETTEKDDRGYYYYEVIPMGKDGDYWLDRNIAAKASTQYIDVEDDTSNIDRNAAGLLYTIGTPRYFDEVDFEESPKFDFGMIPPGYHVPNQTEWDNLRLSNDLKTQSVAYSNMLYMSTYYDTHNDKMGNVYLQKARFYNEPSVGESDFKYTELPNVGDAGAGYYWSITTAPATEKEQMAAWLRALYLNGSSSTYTNASVTDHRMPIRCKAGNVKSATKPEEYYLSFYVHNVTHVYLYDVTGGINTPLFTFPGRAVGTSASAEKWQYFSCSTTVPLENLRMIFVKLEGDGVVTIHTKELREGVEQFTSSNSYSPDYLKPENSWEVRNGKYYDFCETASERTDDNGNLVSNIFTSEPSDCDTGSNSGGNGSGEIKQGMYEHARGSSLEPEGLIIWAGEQYVGWNYQTDVKYSDWDLLKPGSYLRIYGIPSGEGTHQVHMRKQNWQGNFCNQPDSSFGYQDVDGYVEIELKDDLLNDIRSFGLAIVGENFILRYVTIIGEWEEEEDEDPSNLRPDSFEWSGNKPINWGNAWDPMKDGAYNWSQVPIGTFLVIEFTGSGHVLQICDNNWSTIDEYRDGSPLRYELTKTRLQRIKRTNGLLIQGENATIIKAKLEFPSGTTLSNGTVIN